MSTTHTPNQFHPWTDIMSTQSTPSLKTSQFRSGHKTKSISIRTLYLSSFRPAHTNEVNFVPRTKNKSILNHTLKPSPPRSRKNIQGFLDPVIEIKSISIYNLTSRRFIDASTHKSSEFRSRHENVIFDSHTKTK